MAAILTPPDVVSQIMLAAPILIMYEIGIWICVVVTKKREKELEISNPAMNEV